MREFSDASESTNYPEIDFGDYTGDGSGFDGTDTGSDIVRAMSDVWGEQDEAVERIEDKFSEVSDWLGLDAIDVHATTADIPTINEPEKVAGKILELGSKENWFAGVGRFLTESAMKKAAEELTGDALSGGTLIGIRAFGYGAERVFRKLTDGDIIQTPDHFRAKACEGIQFVDCAFYASRGELERCPSFEPLINKYGPGRLESKLDDLLDKFDNKNIGAQSAQLDPDAEAKRRHHEWVVSEFHYVTVKEMDRELRRLTETSKVQQAIRTVISRRSIE